MMATSEPYFSLVKTGASSWTAVLVPHAEPTTATEKQDSQPAGAAPRAGEAGALLPENVATTPAERTERFPRLAIAVVTFLIFAVSLSAEIEYLRQSGFSLR
jgi:predicted cobalt transporter CbtA